MDDSALARSFPPDFTWGAATAAYQIEGASTADGRGPSIWDTFSAEAGRVHNGDTGEVAVDHYHRYRDDVSMMAGLGLRAYRFSLAWPRIQPTGRGELHTPGLDFYDRLVDALLAAGITPWATLYHWDLPQALQDFGGWPERDTALRFADYAVATHAHLADRVRHWATLNEPWCSAFLGHQAGVHAPGATDPVQAVRAAHHLMLGHGLALEGIRESHPDPGELGIVLNLQATSPATDDPRDADAARRVDGIQNRIWLGPLTGRGYPADLLADLDPLAGGAHRQDGDEATIAATLDWIGLNYYTPAVVTARPEAQHLGEPADAYPGCADVRMVTRGGAVTAMGWAVVPQGLTDTLAMLGAAAPGVPVVVTENGAAFDDVLTGGAGDDDRAVHDPERVDYLRSHLQAVAAARADGVDVRGYFVWSLLDNYEWAYGYSKRFGVVHVDYPTQVRTPKDSAHWYADLLVAHRASIHPPVESLPT